jgi:hypothetical protein
MRTHKYELYIQSIQHLKLLFNKQTEIKISNALIKKINEEISN